MPKEKLPEIIVFAGPNGSGKSTITQFVKVIEPYINADEIKKATNCTDLEAAQKAEKMRNQLVEEKQSFTFETVLSTERNLNLLKKAKQAGFFIRCVYILTKDSSINVLRVKVRHDNGGHNVPEEKIRSRYEKCFLLLPQLIEVCDIFHLYDNTTTPFRIFKKRKDEYFVWENEFWSKEKIESMTKTENTLSFDEMRPKSSGEKIIVYTDGGCHGNPGVGGWACVVIADGVAREMSGGEKRTTNNRMELTAAISALTAIYNTERLRSRPIQVNIDSQYVKNGITSWIFNWKKNGWRTAAKKPVLNQELWQKLDSLHSALSVEWIWVKGHAGVEYNERCDQLCQIEMSKLEKS